MLETELIPLLRETPGLVTEVVLEVALKRCVVEGVTVPGGPVAETPVIKSVRCLPTEVTEQVDETAVILRVEVFPTVPTDAVAETPVSATTVPEDSKSNLSAKSMF